MNPTRVSNPTQSKPPLDLAVFGRRLKGARIMAGYNRMTDLASALEDGCGLSMSARSLYAIERGEQMPTLEQAICLVSLLSEGDTRFFLPAVREDLRISVYGHSSTPEGAGP